VIASAVSTTLRRVPEGLPQERLELPRLVTRRLHSLPEALGSKKATKQ
jgi:hypothetical protein